MKFVGLYLNGKLMKKYDYTEIGVIEAINGCKFAFEETGMFHELKLIDEAEQ